MYYYLTIQLLAIVDSTNGKKRYIWFGFGRHVFSNNTADCYVSVYQSVSSHWQRFLWSRRQGWVDKLNYSTVDVYDSRPSYLCLCLKSKLCIGIFKVIPSPINYPLRTPLPFQSNPLFFHLKIRIFSYSTKLSQIFISN